MGFDGLCGLCGKEQLKSLCRFVVGAVATVVGGGATMAVGLADVDSTRCGRHCRV